MCQSHSSAKKKPVWFCKIFSWVALSPLLPVSSPLFESHNGKSARLKSQPIYDMCKWGTTWNIQPSSFVLLGHPRSGSTERADYSQPSTGLHSQLPLGSASQPSWSIPVSQSPALALPRHSAQHTSPSAPKMPQWAAHGSGWFGSFPKAHFNLREPRVLGGCSRAGIQQTCSVRSGDLL